MQSVRCNGIELEYVYFAPLGKAQKKIFTYQHYYFKTAAPEKVYINATVPPASFVLAEFETRFL